MLAPDAHLAPPDTRAVLEAVADDVYRVTIPVPFRGLRHVNAYLLRGPDGWDLVDTGLASPEAPAVWAAVRARLGIGPADLHQIILTHHHPDHMGLAGRLQRAAQEATGRPLPVRMSPREIEIVGIIWQDRADRREILEAYFACCGLPDPADANFSNREFDWIRRTVEPFPAFEPLPPGRPVQIGARPFETLLVPGHSDGHLVFFDPAGGLLLTGDHVLPHITPNIARWPGVEDDPLGRYLGSLGALRRLPVRRALPGHGGVLDDWHGRLAALEAHHAERLAAMQHAVGAGATVFDVTQRAFQHRPLDRHELRMAVAETLAHLEHLMQRRRLRRLDDQPWWFEPA